MLDGSSRKRKSVWVRLMGWAAVACALLALPLLFGCSGPTTEHTQKQPLVVTDLNFLADVVKNVGGDAVRVQSVIPGEVDPHSFQATPKDARLLSQAALVVINVRGLEPSLEELIASVVDNRTPVVEAAAGIPGKTEDPHVWLDPINITTYTQNIAQALSELFPTEARTFGENAEKYNGTLKELDVWIKEQVATIPPSRRLLVTNHESLGYFAKRYGFTVVGTILPGVSGENSPSPRELSSLVDTIRQTGAPAIFLEVGDNLQLAHQISAETGIKVITDLHVHSLGGGISTYIDMMRWNVTRIVEALR